MLVSVLLLSQQRTKGLPFQFSFYILNLIKSN
nr:MAG TPA: hypothetical protein [Caudoviricetes sp.]